MEFQNTDYFFPTDSIDPIYQSLPYYSEWAALPLGANVVWEHHDLDLGILSDLHGGSASGQPPAEVPEIPLVPDVPPPQTPPPPSWVDRDQHPVSLPEL